MDIDKNSKKSEESDDDDASKITTVTEIVDVNDKDSEENDNLYVGAFGNGQAFLRSTLYKALRENKVLKIKVMLKNTEFPQRPKKLIAELFQIKDFSGKNSLVLFTKDDFPSTSYIAVVDYLKANFTFKNLATFESIHHSEYLFIFKFYFSLVLSNEDTRDKIKNKLCNIKNTVQLQQNKLITGVDFPFPNSVGGFSAHLLTWAEMNNIPSVCYISVSDYYDICMDSIKIFYSCASTYAVMREKLDEEYLKMNSVNLKMSVFVQYQTAKNMLYV